VANNKKKATLSCENASEKDKTSLKESSKYANSGNFWLSK